MATQPFSGLSFFLLAGLLVAVIHAGKPIFQRLLRYENLLFGLTAIYVVSVVTNGWKSVLFALFFASLILGVRRTRLPMWVALCALIVPLFLVKLSSTLSGHGLTLHISLGAAGLSYITFRAIQTLLDSPHEAPLGLRDNLTFFLFPPALLAGPIDRSYRFRQDLEAGYANVNAENLREGLRRIGEGMVYKFLFAQLIDRFVLARLPVGSRALSDVLGNAYAYTAFLYFDFAGYSAMAIGLARCVGVTLPENFDKPWRTSTPQDFWRRFHISLGDFLSDYFFKPIYKKLAGKPFFRRHRLMAQNLGLFATFLLMGCWNGLTWYYIASGAMFGVASVVYNTYVQRWRSPLQAILDGRPRLGAVTSAFGAFVTCNYAVFALYLFSGRVA